MRTHAWLALLALACLLWLLDVLLHVRSRRGGGGAHGGSSATR